ncbi:MAG: gamma-glutamyl-gamma-aminobutyrate hydrolase family protein [Gammaproteobacteria bacterium]|nr:gamma-glutamyl-gamma-aminobutyrate hydrolase family protein [Gammaproteobacteria bacterium]MDH3751863.1 gamma-glutamyl-gamma-aminobutyrate hydrolase family protein [Gammaproteobacteria bacterium]
MSKCSPDAFAMAGSTETPMNVVAVIQHTSGEYLGLMEDHLEGRRIRFQYFRPFARGGKLPATDLPADALILLGGGPWGTAGTRDLPSLKEEISLTAARLAEGTPVIGIGLGAQILAIAAGGSVQSTELTLVSGVATRIVDDALNGFLPEEFAQVVYMRDWPVPPDDAKILATDTAGRTAVFQVGNNAYGFAGHPGIKLGMVEDLIMEFEEVPNTAAAELEVLRNLQPRIEDELVPIMTGLVQCTSLMSSPKAAAQAVQELDK